MKKWNRLTAAALAAAMSASLIAAPVMADKLPYTPEWEEYDSLIEQARLETDPEARELLLHQAEDILMDSGAAIPVYYYNDVMMVSSALDNYWVDSMNVKYLMYATGADTLRVQFGSEHSSQDPALASASDLITFLNHIFVGLITKDADNNFVPALAEELPTVSEDGLTYSFELKEGLKWSDGSDLTAADFAYSWNRAAKDETAADYQAFFTDYVATNEDGSLKIDVVDDLNFSITLKAPCGYYLDLLAFSVYYPVKQAAVEAAEGWETNPGVWASEAGFVCNGAFTVTEWKHGESMVLEKNPYFYDADKVSATRMEVMLTEDDVAAYSAFQNKDLDFSDSIPVNEIPNAMQTEEFLKVDSLGPYYISWSVISPIFEGKTPEQASAMRRAIGLLLDREWIVEKCAQAGQTPAASFVPDFMYSYDYEYPVDNGDYGKGYFSITDLDANREEAIELLKFAGFEFTDDGMLSDATPLTLHYLTNDSSGHIAVAEAMQQDLAAVGIEMTIDKEDWDTFLEDRKNGNYDVGRNGWTADYNDPINLLEIFTSNNNNNSCQLGQ